jgi:hypothetical protein
MDINLDGGEKEMIKAIGIGSAAVSGKQLIAQVSGVEEAEFLSTLRGLLDMGYVLADKQAFHDFNDVEHAEFRVNAGYARDLKEALDPRLKRARQEQRKRRTRRE